RLRVDDDWASGVAVNDRIADQVGEHLLQAILIGCDGDYGGRQLDGTLGMRNTKLVDDLRQCVSKIHWLRIEFESTREPTTRDIEDLRNPAAHAGCARLHARELAVGRRVVLLGAWDARAHPAGRQCVT